MHVQNVETHPSSQLFGPRLAHHEDRKVIFIFAPYVPTSIQIKDSILHIVSASIQFVIYIHFLLLLGVPYCSHCMIFVLCLLAQIQFVQIFNFALWGTLHCFIYLRNSEGISNRNMFSHLSEEGLLQVLWRTCRNPSCSELHEAAY